MSRIFTARNRYIIHRDRHQVRRVLAVLRGIMTHDQDALFPDLDLAQKKPRKPVSGLLNFPATYNPEPVEAGQASGPIFDINPLRPNGQESE